MQSHNFLQVNYTENNEVATCVSVELGVCVCVCSPAPSSVCVLDSACCLSSILRGWYNKKRWESKSISHTPRVLCFISMKPNHSRSGETVFITLCLRQVKSIAHLDITGWLLYHSNEWWQKRKEKKGSLSKKTHSLDFLFFFYIPRIVTCFFFFFFFWQGTCFPLLSRQQPNSQDELSAPYCNTSQGDWQTNRWGCHMFVKESAKCSLQLTNSSDAFPLRDSLSLFLHSCRSLHLGETHKSLHVSLARPRCGRLKHI